MKLVLASYTLWLREFTRFYRQKNRVIGAFLQPVIFWILIGSGLNASFSAPKMSNLNYIEYIYPGMILMIVLFTSIFSTITIIEDRKQGFLQGVLASSAPRSSIVLGKVFGGITLSCIQAGLFLLFLYTPFLNIQISIINIMFICCSLFFISFFLTCVGVIMAWPMDSIHGYHALMSVLLFPLWLFSGAAFPADGAPSWLGTLMAINPLSYGMNLLRESFYYNTEKSLYTSQQIFGDMTVFLLFSIAAFGFAIFMVRRKDT